MIWFQYPSSRVILPDIFRNDRHVTRYSQDMFQYPSSRVILPDGLYEWLTERGNNVGEFQYPSSRVILPDPMLEQVGRLFIKLLISFNTPVVG